MPWKTQDKMSVRHEFVELANLEGSNIRDLCRRFGISPTTAYKWLGRYTHEGPGGLKEQSRRPHHSPNQSCEEVERLVVSVRKAHPAWGARKIRSYLELEGYAGLPAVSTMHAILQRHGQIAVTRSKRDLQRFERSQPNELWQMDFKGHFKTDVGRCHPFTLIDDHSRYALGIFACQREDRESVQPHLEQLFGKFGLPQCILCDNGPPWGNSLERCPITSLGVWLLKLGVDVIHGRPAHPQTQGKLERFHRSFKAEVLQQPTWRNQQQCQKAFDQWRVVYNEQRPHEALGGQRPASRYRLSVRQMPATLPEIEYDQDVVTRKVTRSGCISYKSHFFYVGRAFHGHCVGLIPLDIDGVFEVRFGWKRLGGFDLNQINAPKGYQHINVWDYKL